MKIVIDIPEEAYNTLFTEQCIPNGLDLEYLVMHGTPLPKGHGRLIDADKLLEHYDSIEYFNGIENRKIHFVQIGYIHDAPTIIEADGGGE